MKDRFAHLRETLDQLPSRPGVYKMKDTAGATLYIGKAKSLRSRVRTYFQASAAHSPRIAVMTGLVRSIDVVVTASELEALILEDNLVKKEQPRFNVMLRDDKNYPYLKLTMEESFPRLILVRKVFKDGGTYFGPYVSAKAVRATVRLIHKIFPLRQSKDNLDGKPPRRPCLNFQMGRCLAPCAGKATNEEYREVVDQVAMLLKGRNEELIESLNEKMMEAARREWFELAARRRDQIASIKKLNERQTITDTKLKDEDVIVSYEEAGTSVIKILRVRRGKLDGERSFFFDRLDRLDRAEALAAFIRQFYTGGMAVPGTIVVNEEPEGPGTLGEFLAAKRGSKVTIAVPARGRLRKLVDLAENNARLQLAARLDSDAGRRAALGEIQDRLGLAEAPAVIEGYDISNTGGVSPVGSIVVFRGGAPSKSDFRKYKIKSVAGPDDYASMAEVVHRRFKRLAEDSAPRFAGLLVIDGGKGQVNAIVKTIREQGLEPPPIVGIAKGADRENPESDEFYIPGESAPVPFPPSSPGRHLLQRVRDEAHRFAVSFHRKLRDESMKRSSLDAIPGVGPKRKKALLKKFGSVKAVRAASLEDIRETLGVSDSVAKKIYESL